jgi:phosphotransacetylase|tara:strand:- start:4524 stop:4703 length:180 start_codon:yes stop_codon:yes gene_type:complete
VPLVRQISLTLAFKAATFLELFVLFFGSAEPVHVVSQSITVRGLLNMSALAVVQAQAKG